MNIINLKTKITLTLVLTAACALSLGGSASAAPQNAADVLTRCNQLNAAQTVLLPEAVAIAQSCLDNLYGQRSYTVTARSGQFGVSMCPPAQNATGVRCMGIKEVLGIIITAKGNLPGGDPFLTDLRYSLNLRGGKLLGWNVLFNDQLVAEASILDVQSWKAGAEALVSSMWAEGEIANDLEPIDMNKLPGAAKDAYLMYASQLDRQNGPAAYKIDEVQNQVGYLIITWTDSTHVAFDLFDGSGDHVASGQALAGESIVWN